MNDAIALFAERCVLPEHRERFMHEATKRPGHLHKRICHRAGETFRATFHSGTVTFAPNERCLLLDSIKGFREATWEEIQIKTALYGGLLVISLDAAKFYAESEAEPKVQVWAGIY